MYTPLALGDVPTLETTDIKPRAPVSILKQPIEGGETSFGSSSFGAWPLRMAQPASACRHSARRHSVPRRSAPRHFPSAPPTPRRSAWRSPPPACGRFACGRSACRRRPRPLTGGAAASRRSCRRPVDAFVCAALNAAYESGRMARAIISPHDSPAASAPAFGPFSPVWRGAMPSPPPPRGTCCTPRPARHALATGDPRGSASHSSGPFPSRRARWRARCTLNEARTLERLAAVSFLAFGSLRLLEALSGRAHERREQRVGLAAFVVAVTTLRVVVAAATSRVVAAATSRVVVGPLAEEVRVVVLGRAAPADAFAAGRARRGEGAGPLLVEHLVHVDVEGLAVVLDAEAARDGVERLVRDVVALGPVLEAAVLVRVRHGDAAARRVVVDRVALSERDELRLVERPALEALDSSRYVNSWSSVKSSSPADAALSGAWTYRGRSTSRQRRRRRTRTA